VLRFFRQKLANLKRFKPDLEALTRYAYRISRSADFTMKSIYWNTFPDRFLITLLEISRAHSGQHIYSCFVSACTIGSTIWPKICWKSLKFLQNICVISFGIDFLTVLRYSILSAILKKQVLSFPFKRWLSGTSCPIGA
jgi:hypothetical protein